VAGTQTSAVCPLARFSWSKLLLQKPPLLVAGAAPSVTQTRGSCFTYPSPAPRAVHGSHRDQLSVSKATDHRLYAPAWNDRGSTRQAFAFARLGVCEGQCGAVVCLPGRATLGCARPRGQPTGTERYGWDLLGVMDIDTPEVKFLDRRGIAGGEGVMQGHVR